MSQKSSSEYFTGKQYHIGCSLGDLAPTILLCGDPERAVKVSKKFSKINFEGKYREFKTFTGVFEEVPLSVMATGIGADNTDIAVIETTRCFPLDAQITFIRIGSSGTIQKHIKIGDLIISSSAICRENTSSFYVNAIARPKSDLNVLQALKEAAEKLNFIYHEGITCSTSSFYGGQGRNVPGFAIKDQFLVDDFSKIGVLNFEMETSILFNLANHVIYPKERMRAGSVCAVYANRLEQNGFDPEKIEKAESRCIDVGLLAAKILFGRGRG